MSRKQWVYRSEDQRDETGRWLATSYRTGITTLIDTGCGNPAIDPRVFPIVTDDDEGAIPYWSSSPAGVANLIAFVDFAIARIDGHSSGFALFVRFVKDNRG